MEDSKTPEEKVTCEAALTVMILREPYGIEKQDDYGFLDSRTIPMWHKIRPLDIDFLQYFWDEVEEDGTPMCDLENTAFE